MFINSAGAQCGPDIFGHEFVAQVFNINFSRASSDRFLLQAGELFSLSDIACDRNYFAIVFFLKPGNDNRGIEPARIGERDTFNCVRHRWIMPPVYYWVEVERGLYTP